MGHAWFHSDVQGVGALTRRKGVVIGRVGEAGEM